MKYADEFSWEIQLTSETSIYTVFPRVVPNSKGVMVDIAVNIFYTENYNKKLSVLAPVTFLLKKISSKLKKSTSYFYFIINNIKITIGLKMTIYNLFTYIV